MIYVEHDKGKLVYCYSIEDFIDRFKPEYDKVREYILKDFCNSDMYDENNPNDIENAEGYVEEMLCESHIKDSWNEVAHLCDVPWTILYVGDLEFDDIAEALIEKNYNELKYYIMKRLLAYENDDRYPDKEDDELTNFMLENFNKENL